MKKIFIAFISGILVLSAVGCNQTPTYISSNSTNDTENNQLQEQLLDLNDYDEFLADIYLCDDVYRTDDTPTHGSGSISLPMSDDILKLEDYQILLCTDGCEPSDIVSRASQGYAIAYPVVSDGKLDGSFQTLKFKMSIPERMAEDLKNQGSYESIKARIESNYYYLIVLDEKHFAYIHLARKEGTEKTEHEAELADSIVKNAKISFES